MSSGMFGLVLHSAWRMPGTAWALLPGSQAGAASVSLPVTIVFLLFADADGWNNPGLG